MLFSSDVEESLYFSLSAFFNALSSPLFLNLGVCSLFLFLIVSFASHVAHTQFEMSLFYLLFPPSLCLHFKLHYFYFLQTYNMWIASSHLCFGLTSMVKCSQLVLPLLLSGLLLVGEHSFSTTFLRKNQWVQNSLHSCMFKIVFVCFSLIFEGQTPIVGS